MFRLALDGCGSLGRHGVAGLSPGMHAAKKRTRIFELITVFLGPPGRGGFVRSGAVENDFLVLWNGSSHLGKFLEVKGTGEANVLAFLFVVVGAHHEGVAIARLLKCLRSIYAGYVAHALLWEQSMGQVQQ